MLRTTRFAAVAFILAIAACSPPQAAQAPAETPVTRVEAASSAPVVVTSPMAGARVTSPLSVDGAAPGDWYFEAQFPAKLVGADGRVLAEAPAMTQDDVITEAPVPFHAELQFTVTQATPATLVLQEDMPADNAHPREVRVSIVLVPR